MACPRFFRWLKFFSESFVKLRYGRRKPSPSELLRCQTRLFELESRYVAGNLLMPLGWEYFGTPTAETYVSAGFSAEEPAWEARQTSVAADDALAGFTIALPPSTDNSQSEDDQDKDAARAPDQTATDTLFARDDLAPPDWLAEFEDPLGPSPFSDSKTAPAPSGASSGGLDATTSPILPQSGGGGRAAAGGGGGNAGGGGGGITTPGPDFGPVSEPAESGGALPAAPLSIDGRVSSAPPSSDFGAPALPSESGDETYPISPLDGGGSNSAPVAITDTYDVRHDYPLVVEPPGVLSNDSDPDGDQLTVILVSGPANGTLSSFGDQGEFVYLPSEGFVGTDLFFYQASDGELLSDPIAVTINLTNTSPTASNDSYGLATNSSLLVPEYAGVLANDQDADGDTLAAELVMGPSEGELTLNSDGSFSYTPDQGFAGNDSFTYQASDGVVTTSVATVTLNIHTGNEPPIANDDSYTTLHNAPLIIYATGVLANDADTDFDLLSAAQVTGPTNGTLTLNSNGSFTYTPDTNFVGNDSFTYSAHDGTDVSDPATVTIAVTNQLCPPSRNTCLFSCLNV